MVRTVLNAEEIHSMEIMRTYQGIDAMKHTVALMRALRSVWASMLVLRSLYNLPSFSLANA